jgi:parallel beta-helix repeat protein
MILRTNVWSGLILCCLVASAILVFSSPPSEINVKSRSSDSFHAIIADTTPHAPINISSNQDFILQGWPGNGTEEAPYEIEALSIDTTGCCINISNTNVFFAVTGCMFHTTGEDDRQCVHFQNVTRGYIATSLIESYTAGIFLENCEYCSIEQCVIHTTWRCINLGACYSCAVLSTTLFSYSDGISAQDCFDLEVAFNNVNSTSGDDGVAIDMCPDFVIVNNSIYGFSDRGIAIYSSQGGILANNTIQCTIGFRGFRGLSLDNLTNCRIINNDVSICRYGIDYSDSHDCLVESNSIHNNDYGIMTWSGNCNYSKNVFVANLYSNAEDNGNGNSWLQNWWDDYIGYGWYPISGSAGSFDTDPNPKNTVLLVGTIVAIGVISLIALTVITGATIRIRRRSLVEPALTDWDAKERLTLPLMVTTLLPSNVFLYLPAYSPARSLILGATPLGVISWTAYPSWGHHSLEFILPVTDEIQIVLYYVLFGLLWFMLSAFLVRQFWLFIGGEIPRSSLRRSTLGVLSIVILMSLLTMTIPLPWTLLAIIIQMSRIKDQEEVKTLSDS